VPKSLDLGTLDMDHPGLGQEVTREFTLFDAVVSVAAVGLALAFARPHLTYLGANLWAIPIRGPAGWAGVWSYLRTRTDVTYSIVIFSFNSLYSFLFAWTLAFLVMRLRKPRPSLNRLVKQPGMVACEVLLFGMILTICLAWHEDYQLLASVAVVSTALAIPVAWAILALRGRWAAEPSWIDRLGRGLGICWSVSIPLQMAFMHLTA
jgi:hypothetical protein